MVSKTGGALAQIKAVIPNCTAVITLFVVMHLQKQNASFM
jgi:hypothetical protein